MAQHAWPTITPARSTRLVREIASFIECYRDESFEGWDEGEVYICDGFTEFFDNYDNDYKCENKHNDFYDRLRCCLRAGLDVAYGDCGVIGFTVGDLRRMYPEGIPTWITEAYEHPEYIATAEDGAGIWL